MRQAKSTAPRGHARQIKKTGLSPLAAVSLVLVMLAGGAAVWLQMSGPPERGPGAPAVVVKLSPPPQPAAPAPPPAQAKAPKAKAPKAAPAAPATVKAPESAPAAPAKGRVRVRG